MCKPAWRLGITAGARKSPTICSVASGIAARALDGRPGPRSARYAGPTASDEENLNLLLSELAGAEDRSVAYVCALAYVEREGNERVVIGPPGRCHGPYRSEPRVEALPPP